jgi:hypothetical protein
MFAPALLACPGLLESPLKQPCRDCGRKQPRSLTVANFAIENSVQDPLVHALSEKLQKTCGFYGF